MANLQIRAMRNLMGVATAVATAAPAALLLLLSTAAPAWGQYNADRLRGKAPCTATRTTNCVVTTDAAGSLSVGTTSLDATTGMSSPTIPSTPLKWGADPTGVADSTAAVNSCLAAGPCFIPPGSKFKVSTLTHPTGKDFKLYGLNGLAYWPLTTLGSELVVTAPPLVLELQQGNATLSGLRITTPTDSTAVAVKVVAAHQDKHFEISHNQFNNPYTVNPTGTGIRLEAIDTTQATNVHIAGGRIQNNFFYSFALGVQAVADGVGLNSTVNFVNANHIVQNLCYCSQFFTAAATNLADVDSNTLALNNLQAVNTTISPMVFTKSSYNIATGNIWHDVANDIYGVTLDANSTKNLILGDYGALGVSDASSANQNQYLVRDGGKVWNWSVANQLVAKQIVAPVGSTILINTTDANGITMQVNNINVAELAASGAFALFHGQTSIQKLNSGDKIDFLPGNAGLGVTAQVVNAASNAYRPYTQYASSFTFTGGTFATDTLGTTANCSSSASPAVCAAAPAGSVAVAAAATTVMVNTTAITANSQVLVTFDSSLGTKLGVTCNTTPVQPTVSARTAATSFTITVPVAPDTNPACFSYSIIN